MSNYELIGRETSQAAPRSVCALALLLSASGGCPAATQSSTADRRAVGTNPVALMANAGNLRVSADPTLRDFGWSATSEALRSAHFSIDLICGLETTALKENSVASLSSVANLYRNQEPLARLRLGQTQANVSSKCRTDIDAVDGEITFLIAVMSMPKHVISGDLQGLSASRRYLSEAARQGVALERGFSKTEPFAQLTATERGAAAWLLARGPPASVTAQTMSEIQEVLADCAVGLAGALNSTVDSWIARQCAEQLSEMPSSLSLPRIAGQEATANSTLQAGSVTPWSPPPGSDVVVGTILSAYAEAQSLAGSCSFTHTAKIWSGPITGGVTSLVQGVWTGTSARMLPDSNVIAGGCVFEPIIVGADEADSAGLPSMAFGVRHRTWGQSGSVRFNARLMYFPSPGALAIAFRFKSYNPSPTGVCGSPTARKMECAGGCFAATVVEPGTGWIVMPINPGRALDLRLSFDSCVETMPQCAGPKNSMIPRVFEETMATVEIGGRELNIFAKIDPAALPEVGTRVENGLLTYIAALVRESEPGGWLSPEAAQIERAVALSKTRLGILQRLSEIPAADIEKNLRPELLDSTSDLYVRSPWRERQKSLGIFLPHIRHKLERHYRESLAAGVAAAAVGLDDLKSAQKLLTTSVRRLNSLGLADLDRAIQQAADTLHKTNPPAAATEGRRELEVAVVGASALVDNVLLHSLTEQRLRCGLWKAFDWNSLPIDDLKRATDGFCTTVGGK